MSDVRRDTTDPNGDAGGPRIEVAVRQAGEPYLKVRLARGKATVGRGDEATVQLESRHVSRVHFTLDVRDAVVWVIDAGSRNGIKVNGKRVKEQEVEPGDVVAVPGFELAYRWLHRRGDTQPNIVPAKRDTIGGGWDDYLEEGDLEDDRPAQREEITNVTAKPEPEPAPAADSAPEPHGEAGSVLNRLAYRRETGRRRPFTTDAFDDEEEEEFSTPPNVEPLVLRMKDEANGLLYGTQEGDLAVEVIEAWDEKVHRVALLRLGQSFWWGGEPGWFTRPNDELFPLVAYLEEGEYLVQRPDDPSWTLFHRGERELDVQRIAGLISCVAEWEDQVEVRHGTFSVYARCIRIPTVDRPPFSLSQILPGKIGWLALAGSLLLHSVVAALPAPTTLDPFAQLGGTQRDDSIYVDYMLEPEPMPEPEPEPDPVPPPPAPPPPEPVVEPPPPEVPELGPTKKELTRPEAKRRRREPKVEPPGREEAQQEAPIGEASPNEDPPTPAPAPKRKQVTVDSFKVYGMIGHLPELRLSEGQASRGSRRVLHGATAQGVVSKAPNLMGIRPLGTLSKEQVSRVVNTKTREVYGCYTEVLETHPTAQGRVEMWWSVDAQGKVAQVKVLRDTVGSTELVRCLRDAVRAWRFPPPKGGSAQVTFPFTFRRPKL